MVVVHIRALRRAIDHFSFEMLSGILLAVPGGCISGTPFRDEEGHFDQYEKQYDNIKRFGLSYLALQSFDNGAVLATVAAAD
jgi:hypothetical protein